MPKLKLKLETLFGKPIVQMTPQGPALTGYEFLNAFEKLCRDPLPIYKHMELAPAKRALETLLKDFETSKQAAIKKHGRPQLELLNERAAELKLELTAQPPLPAVIQKELKKIEEAIERVTKSGEEHFIIPTADKKANDAFNAELKELLAQEVELPLKKKIALTPDSKLNALDCEALLEIVEVVEPTED
jgi:hypothetical protein